MRAFYQSLITLFALLQLASCGPNAEFEQQLVGYWEGIDNERAFRWCIAVEEAGEFEIILLQWKAEEQQPAATDDYRRTSNSGTWELYDGNRWLLTQSQEGATVENSTKAAEDFFPIRIPPYYIVKSVDDTNLLMTSNPKGQGNSWVSSRRVEGCQL